MSEIYYSLPNNQRIELLSEMRTANFDFGDFEETIEDLRNSYYQMINQGESEIIEGKIKAQCSAFADFLGIQYEEIQSMIGFDDLSNGIKQALIPDCDSNRLIPSDQNGGQPTIEGFREDDDELLAAN